MANGLVQALKVVVVLLFIGIHLSFVCGEPLYMAAQGLTVSVFDHAQTHFATLASNGANNRRAVIVIGAVSMLFIRPPSGWVSWVKMHFLFFSAF